MTEALESPAARSLLLEHEGLRGLRTTVFYQRERLRPPPRLGEHTEEVIREWLPARPRPRA